ncbi:hypothetical protein BDM02DRAFT_3121302 [Thelephora ganbajun]|uniref:Uncharacterized protein n=1 Tax=Thelephora ganbajun TaxID=370292 RepID=A0ACB6Z663_THEGA|nr:hypothetical protein BDM02DRAFT_3121302 [Thelephora ganbajun]
MCSDTLECLDITHNLFGHTGPASIDLSKATKLRDTIFRARSLSVAWITMAFRSTPNGLAQTSKSSTNFDLSALRSGHWAFAAGGNEERDNRPR